MAEKEKKTVKRAPAKKSPAKPVVEKTVVEAKPAPSVQKASGLTPLSELWGETWKIFKQSLWVYIKIFLVGVGLFFIAFAIGLLILVPLFISSGGNVRALLQNITPVEIAFLTLFILWGFAYLGTVIVYSILSSVAYILYLNDRRKWSIAEFFHASRPYFWKYLIASILVGIAVMGTVVWLFVPALVVGILFSFVPYVVVLENKKGIAALQRSYEMVRVHFWGIVGRFVVLYLIMLLITQVFASFEEDSMLVSLLSFIFSFVSGWFGMIYTYLIYKQVRTVPSTSKSSITWIWVLTLLGWIVFIAIFLFALATPPRFVLPPITP